MWLCSLAARFDGAATASGNNNGRAIDDLKAFFYADKHANIFLDPFDSLMETDRQNGLAIYLASCLE